MGTRRIDRKEIEGLPVLAEGYKIFNDDWSCLGYCYADENGSVEGSVHKEDGEIVCRKNGLHFCKEMLDCYKYHTPLQCNKFAKVRAYGTIAEDGDKTACQILEIVEVLTWNEHLEAAKTYCPYGVNRSDGVDSSNGVNRSDGVNSSYGVNLSYGVNSSDGVNLSDGVDSSYGVNLSHGVSTSNGVYKVAGAVNTWFCRGSEALLCCIFCNDIAAKSYYLFNKPVEKERTYEVIDGLKTFGWTPDFTNAGALKEGKEWKEVPAHKIKAIAIKEAYSKMPKEMLEYIRSLPEYDEDIFNAVTGEAFRGV